MNINDQENLSTEQSPPGEETWISVADGDEKRTSGNCAPSREGAQTSNSAPLLKIIQPPPVAEFDAPLDFTLPKANRLRKPREFQTVYKNGKKIDGRLMSVFVLPNDFSVHRLGITASRKGVGNAVQRNRAKRLLREAFRLSKIELNRLENRYDVVINARRGLLKIKMPDALADFRKILTHIARGEQKTAGDNPKVEPKGEKS